MSFLRPEARATLWRWREVLVGGAALVMGVWLVAGPGQLLAVPGGALVLGGAALVWIGGQRGRFRGAGGGTGAVEVDEGQVSYFGPLSGGVVALRDMTALSLERAHLPAHWRLDQPGQPPLMIPVDAAGAEALFDAFASLPGLRTEALVSALNRPGGGATVVWQRPGRPPQRPAALS